MGKEKEKEKSKDKDKEKEKKKEKEKEKEKSKDKEKKEKKKSEKEKDKKEKSKDKPDQTWKMEISQHLDTNIATFEKITKTFKDIDDYILKSAKSKEEFVEKVNESIEKLPEAQKNIFLAFLNSLS